MIKYLQLPFYFDVQALQEDLRFLAGPAWKLHYQQLHYEGEWSAIPLRSSDGLADNIIISPYPDAVYKNTEWLDHCPYIQKVLSCFQCPLGAVRLLKLKAGAIIKEHRDGGLQFEQGKIRIHIPVITNDRVEFYLDDERMHLKEGEAWYMNFNLLHRIANNSDQDRIHLVIDADVNDWVKELFSGEAVMNKKETEEEDPHDDATKRQMILNLRKMNTPVANRLADALEAGLKKS